MSAVWPLSASCCRTGAAEEEICTDRGSLPWSCSASIFTILPFSIVTRTWASPYWVDTASPVAVPDPAAAVDEDFVGVVEGAEAVAVCVTGVDGWNASAPAVPATVAAMTRGDRRIGGSVLRT